MAILMSKYISEIKKGHFMVLKRVIHQEDITILLCTSGSSPDQVLLKPSLKDFEHNLASM